MTQRRATSPETSLTRPVVAGVIVPTDALHPMVYAGACLKCGRQEMSPGCVARDQGDRLRALRDRGVHEEVLRLLGEGGTPDDLRQIESLGDEQIAEMNAVAARRS